VGDRPPTVESEVDATTPEWPSRVAVATPNGLGGWPTTPDENREWPVPPPVAPGVVAPPLALHSGWPTPQWGGRPTTLGFSFFFLLLLFFNFY
jgi:hypothetical protein